MKVVGSNLLTSGNTSECICHKNGWLNHKRERTVRKDHKEEPPMDC
jgi:hypothetical protein